MNPRSTSGGPRRALTLTRQLSTTNNSRRPFKAKTHYETELVGMDNFNIERWSYGLPSDARVGETTNGTRVINPDGYLGRTRTAGPCRGKEDDNKAPLVPKTERTSTIVLPYVPSLWGSKEPKSLLSQSSGPDERVGLDVNWPLPTTERGHRSILVKVDYFTKAVEAEPIRSQNTKAAAQVFISHWTTHIDKSEWNLCSLMCCAGTFIRCVDNVKNE